MKTKAKPQTRDVEILGVQVTMTVLTKNAGDPIIGFDPHFGDIVKDSSPKHTLEYVVDQCIEAAIIFAEEEYLVSTDIDLEGNPIGNKKIKVTDDEGSQ